jgi:hypothetical protein
MAVSEAKASLAVNDRETSMPMGPLAKSSRSSPLPVPTMIIACCAPFPRVRITDLCELRLHAHFSSDH